MTAPQVIIERPPEDDSELWELIRALWGYEFPRTAVCPGHVAPFQAIADAYFARAPVIIWKASRGLGGKTRGLGVLSLTEAATLGAGVTILGGSGQQSINVHDAQEDAWSHPLAPRSLLSREPTTRDTELRNDGWIKALMASQTSVRGPHPNRLRLDEIDDMDMAIAEAAQGQPMRGRNQVETQTVMSGTHQYPDGTMTAMLRRATERGWPVYEWCFRENLTANGGWLHADEVERKKSEVSAAMWAAEYELQEPNPEDRAIDGDSVEACFTPDRGTWDGGNDEYVEIEPPESGADYITGVDWAKRKDWTVVRTFRVDTIPAREVAYLRVQRRPWPVMAGYLNDRIKRYGGDAAHDAIGVGDVVGDFLDVDAEPIELRGQRRQVAFTDYVRAIEGGDIVSARIGSAFNEHRYVEQDDLYGKGHPPDSFIAGAIAWHRYRTRRPAVPVVAPGGEGQTSGWRL